MKPDLSTLASVSKLLFAIELKPIQGARFQPTGFPSLGAATYQTKDGTSLLVESPQSMANRLESTVWDATEQKLKSAVEGISYIHVERDGEFLTSSIIEAHRLNSVYIERSRCADGILIHEKIKQGANYDEKRAVDRAAFIKTLLKYDVNSLLHGVFLESIGGRLRVARALSAFIEAERVQQAISGGVKNDHIQPGKEGERTASEGFGNVPFSREEYTAEHINLFVNIDLGQIRGYGLGVDVERLLVLLALFKLRLLIDGDLRLRTACDFVGTAESIVATKPDGFSLPLDTDLREALRDAIKNCKELMSVTNTVYDESFKPAKKADIAVTNPDEDKEASSDSD